MGSVSAAILPEEEAALWAAMPGPQRDAARHRLFEIHADFAHRLARRQYRLRARGDLEFADLQQFAHAGLLEAIDGFDSRRGAPFRSYASRRILGSIADGIARLSEVRSQMSARARARRDRVRSLLPDDPDMLSAADALETLIELAMGVAVGVMLEGTALFVDDSEAPAPARQPSAFDSARWREITERLGREVAALPERERRILEYHYGERALAFDTIANLLKVSKGRVSQIHRTALVTLRKRLVQRGHFSLER